MKKTIGISVAAALSLAVLAVPALAGDERGGKDKECEEGQVWDEEECECVTTTTTTAPSTTTTTAPLVPEQPPVEVTPLPEVVAPAPTGLPHALAQAAQPVAVARVPFTG